MTNVLAADIRLTLVRLNGRWDKHTIMNILYIAPQPFYIDRGTPIDVKLTLDVLDQRSHTIDMVTYSEGRDLPYKNVSYHRTRHLRWLGHVKPGFSAKKIVCDFFMIGTLFNVLRRKRYDLVYAVEDGVFFAMILKMLLGLPYVYDMDSSMADQLVEKYPFLRPLAQAFLWFERQAIRNARAVVPVCDALGDRAKQHGADKIFLLYDIPIHATGEGKADDLRTTLEVQGLITMYIGNLEAYQGIELLLESFALANNTDERAHLVIIGGANDDIKRYRAKVKSLNVEEFVHFIGPRPVEDIYGYLSQADILVSPRTKGSNTPMKIYSYLASGKPLLATRLWTHTQVLGEDEAVLADPNPAAFAAGLQRLLGDDGLRREIGKAGKLLIDTKHNHARYIETFNACLDWLETGAETASVSAKASL